MGNQQQNPHAVTTEEELKTQRQLLQRSSEKTKEILKNLRPGHIDYDFSSKVHISGGMQGDVYKIKSNID
jgi:preprotein translocase subunit YajC